MKYKKINKKVIITLPKNLYRPNLIEPYDISTVKNRLEELMDEIPAMSKSNYVNPFEETFECFMKVGVSEETRKILEVGRFLNYEQLKFASCNHNKCDNYYGDVIQFIHMANGNTAYVGEVVSQMRQKIISGFNKITEMTPQNFKNPFLEFRKEMGVLTLNIINY